MTEPVAYLAKSRKSGAVNATVNQWSYHDFENIPLYTKEQLQPKVQMTQAEFDEWKELYEDKLATTIYDFIIYVLNHRDSFPDMTNKLMCGSGAVKAKSQAKIADLIVNYNPDNPEKTIEIVPNMKWFVRVDSQIPLPDENIYLDDELIVYPHYDSPKSSAHQFDTKEEAELWTNPLTEAVQLPVEGE